MSGLESLYQELILEHSKRPHGKGIADADAADLRTATSHQRNPICGDEIHPPRAGEPDDTVHDITWDGAAARSRRPRPRCSAVLVDDREGGLTRAQATELIDGFRTALRSRGTIPIDEETYGDAEALSGVSKYTARVKCALLAWVAFEDALARAS